MDIFHLPLETVYLYTLSVTLYTDVKVNGFNFLIRKADYMIIQSGYDMFTLSRTLHSSAAGFRLNSSSESPFSSSQICCLASLKKVNGFNFLIRKADYMIIQSGYDMFTLKEEIG
jgi:hypothetical protein